MVELTQSAPAHWLRRALIGAVAILLCEYLLLSWLVDADLLQRRLAWLSGFGYVAPLAIAIGTAIFIFASTGKANVLVLAERDRPTARRASPYLAVHAVLFLAFLLLTRALFGGQPLLLGTAEAGFMSWALLGLAVIAALTLAILPPRQLFPLVRQARLSLLLGSLVGIAAWIAGRAAEDLWEPLGRLTLSAVAQSLRWLFSDSFSVPNRMLVGTSTFRVIVAPVCSGFEGIGLMIVLLGCWLIACRRQLRFPNALLLVPLGIVMAWVGNVIRIVALIAIGSRWSPAVALGGFHSKAGWVLFCGAALGLMLVSRRAAFFARETPPAETAGDSWNPTAAYLVPFLSGVGVQLVAGLFSIRADFAYPIQLLAVLSALWAYRKSYGRWRFSLSWAVPVIGAGAFVCHFALEGLLGPGTASGSTTSLGLGVRPAGAASAFIQLARTVIVVPLAEELAFRGYLLRRLVSADFTDVSPAKFGLASLLISSLAFGALQSNWIAGAVAGMLYAYALYRRGRIEDAFLAHAVTSLLAVAYSWWFAPLRHT